MRYFIIVLLGIFLSFISCSDPDFVSRNVGRTSETTFNVDTTVENKGKHITSLGELRVLFIFSQFSNDTSSGSSWPSSTVELPHWTNKIINQSPIPKFESDNLTKYFFEMSRGNLMLYGDVYPKPVIPKYPQEKYKSVSEVNYEILSALDDEIDYSKYDHWSNGDNYRFIEAQDGKVDMIFIVYRNFENRLFFDKAWTGAAYLYLTEDIITNDGVKIATGRLDRGSGIQSRGGKSGFEYIKYVLA
ncbi:MAG: hypothetical protein R3250_09735, partial [Melioribacteraceae bacterium]|nr:hypothetical protein [Melioribacteraceae bacterium]